MNRQEGKLESSAIAQWPPHVPVWEGEDEDFNEMHAINITHIGRVPVWRGDFGLLPDSVQRFISHWVLTAFCSSGLVSYHFA